MPNDTPAATLNPREERRILRGHCWAYRNEFAAIPDGLADGQVVDVLAHSGRFVGRGFYQTDGGIAVRVFSRHADDPDTAFFTRRLAAALELRRRLFPGSDVFRWVYGDSDGLPGLVVDRYGSVAVARASSQFYFDRSQLIADCLMAEEGVAAVHFELGGVVRRFGDLPEALELEMDGVRAELRLGASQKTGLFLDQRRNWPLVRELARGARVFDGHCYHGFWSCHAALGGAAAVTAVDSSAAAGEQAQRNLELNGVADRCAVLCGDVEKTLAGGDPYDVVILDPPAFAKTRAQAAKALGRYQALNAAAVARIAPEGGFLVTSSCSHFVDESMFLETVKRAIVSAGRSARLLELRGASPDHPVLLAMPETAYLKCLVLRVD